MCVVPPPYHIGAAVCVRHICMGSFNWDGDWKRGDGETTRVPSLQEMDEDSRVRPLPIPVGKRPGEKELQIK